MTVVSGILVLVIILGIIPVVVGSCFSPVDKRNVNLVFLWISGHMVLWAGFQLLSVPVILKSMDFEYVLYLFSGYIVLWVIIAAAINGYRRIRRQGDAEAAAKTAGTGKGWCRIAWGGVWAILLYQLFQAVFLAYADGDDSFYVAVSGMVMDSGDMYQNVAYTGWTSELDVRHGMAPFPVWIAYIAKLCGFKTVSVNHVVMPLMLIPMTYGIYYLIGNRLFADKKERVPLFLLFTEILVLFGDYSFYTAERFMIARSRQGKAALGNVMIPFLFWLLFLFLEKLQENQKLSLWYWGLLAATMTAGCLCSTMGALLVCMLVGITGLCAAFCYKKWKFLFPLAACCSPCVVYAGLYLILS